MKPKRVVVKEAKDGTVQKLRNRIKKLENENKRLKSELAAYDQAFRKTTRFLRDHTDEISLYELIKAAKEDKSLKQVENKTETVCPKCLSPGLKNIPSPAGKVVVCSNIMCNYRRVEKDDTKGIR